jgi:hypothetical protein
MARLALWVPAVVVGVVVGCQPAKDVPEDIPKNQSVSEGVTVPAASDPAAKAYIEKAVKALTGGKTELLAKGKTSRAVFKGMMSINKTELPTTRTIAAVWPDRYFVANDLVIRGQPLNVRTWLKRPHFTILKGDEEQENFNRAEMEQVLAADATAQYWMALLVPVTDPRAIVFDTQSIIGTSATGQPMPIQLMKLSLGTTLPLYQLTFDAKTDLLLRAEYTTTELGVRRRKQWTASDHKPGPDGLTLPMKTECQHDGLTVELWDVEKWEFPGSIPDTEFDPPKKN